MTFRMFLETGMTFKAERTFAPISSALKKSSVLWLVRKMFTITTDNNIHRQNKRNYLEDIIKHVNSKSNLNLALFEQLWRYNQWKLLWYSTRQLNSWCHKMNRRKQMNVAACSWYNPTNDVDKSACPFSSTRYLRSQTTFLQ